MRLASYKGDQRQFASREVKVLPIPNTTAERLAQWILHQVKGLLIRSGARNLTEIEIEVEEAPGQSASCCEPFEENAWGYVANTL